MVTRGRHLGWADRRADGSDVFVNRGSAHRYAGDANGREAGEQSGDDGTGNPTHARFYAYGYHILTGRRYRGRWRTSDGARRTEFSISSRRHIPFAAIRGVLRDRIGPILRSRRRRRLPDAEAPARQRA